MGVSMYSVSYKQLHKEHMNWISSIKIWKDEITFLHNLCNSQNHSPNIADLKEINNNISHHQRLLDNMESQIHTHKSSERMSSRTKQTMTSTRQEEIDAILDKISQSGYESLSKEEKQKLFNASKK